MGVVMVKVDKFYDDEVKQKKYEERVNELIAEIKKRMRKAYSEVFHFGMIQKIARYELAIYELDKIIQNGKTFDEQAMKDKKAYENELNKLWSNMQIDMKGQRGDTKNVQVDYRDFSEFMADALKEIAGED